MKFVGLMSPADFVALSVAQITDDWYAQNHLVKGEFIAERLAFAAGVDKNGDGLLCVGLSWGQDLNPNSHWAVFYGNLLDPPFTEKWGFFDNHLGTSNND